MSSSGAAEAQNSTGPLSLTEPSILCNSSNEMLVSSTPSSDDTDPRAELKSLPLLEVLDLIHFHVTHFLIVPGGVESLKNQQLRLMELDELLFTAKFALDKARHKQCEWNRVDWEIAKRQVTATRTSVSSRPKSKYAATSTLTLDDLEL